MSGIGGCEEHCPRIGNFTVIAPIDLHPRTESTRIRPIKLLLSLQPQLWGEQNFQKRWFLFWATLTWLKWNSNDLWSRIWVIPFFLSTSCLLCAIWIWGKGSLEIMMHSKIWTYYVVPASSVVSPYRWPLVSPLFSRWPSSWWQFEKAFLPQRRPLWSVSSFCIFFFTFLKMFDKDKDKDKSKVIESVGQFIIMTALSRVPS